MNSYIHTSLLDQAEQFRTAYSLATGKTQRNTQKSLIDEEWSEFHEAFHFESEVNQLKELADLVYVCYQYAASQEWDLDEAMHRVHQSNMSKLGEDGKPIYRADGKVPKRPKLSTTIYRRSNPMTPSELKETLLKQYNDAVMNVQRLEGAIAACTELVDSEEETTVEETTVEADA